MPVRVQLSPSSALIMTPWPIVPTRMVPGFAMLHLLGVRTVPLFLRRDYTPIGEGPRGFERTGGVLDSASRCSVTEAFGRRASRSAGVASGRQPPVEIEGGADERQVRERLREVAEVLRLKAELLAVQPQVIGVAEHLLEEETRLVQVTHAGEALDVPEGTHREGAFIPREPVGEPAAEAIAIDQRVTHQLALDRAEGREPSWIGGGHEADERHQECRRVQARGADMLKERLALRVPEACEDVTVDRVPRLVPARQRGRERTLGGEADRAIDGDPAHHPRVEELLPSAPHLPDALVRPAPVGAYPVDQTQDVRPAVVPDRRTVLVVQVDRVHQLAVDIELEVVESRVPDTDRPGSHVAFEMRQGLLGQRMTAIEPIHDLERAVGLELLAALRHPAHEGGRLFRVAEAHESLEDERRVADPGVAIVPVAPAPDQLGETEGRRGDDGAVLPG